MPSTQAIDALLKVAEPRNSLSTATDRALTVLETLAQESEPLTLSKLAEKCGIPLATCATVMNSLEARGYATRNTIGRSHLWRLTPKLYSIASEQFQRLGFSSVARETLQGLAERVRCPAHIGILNGVNLVYVAKESSPSFVRFDTYPGKVVPFNLTALGKAIAAFTMDEMLDSHFSKLEVGAGPKANPVNSAEFRNELATIRELGYAVEDEEEVAGVACLAVPLQDITGRVVAALGVTGLSELLRAPTLEKVVKDLKTTAIVLSSLLGSSASISQ